MKKFFASCVAIIIVACMILPAFATDTVLPSSYEATVAEDGVHQLDGVIGEDEYDVKIEGIHRENEDHTYGHNPYFTPPSEDKTVDDNVASFYIGFDAYNVYIGMKKLDAKRGSNAERGYSYFGVTIFAGDPEETYSTGLLVRTESDGTLLHRQNYDAAYYHPDMGAWDFDEENVAYKEEVKEDESVVETWEVKLSIEEFQRVTTLKDLGDTFYFRFIVESDNVSEEVVDRYSIGASKNDTKATVMPTSNYWQEFEEGIRLFEVKLEGHIHQYVTAEVEGGHKAACSCGLEGELLEHDWDLGTITVDPTEEAEGEIVYTCFDCEATKTEALEKLESDPSDDKNEDDGEGNTVDDTDVGGADKAEGCGASLSVAGLALVAILGLGVTAVSKKN